MISFVDRISIRSKSETEVVDITNNVQDIVRRSNVKHGQVTIYTGHTTAAIILNEYENGLIQDIVNLMELVVPKNKNYLHNRVDINAHSHLRAILIGTSKVIPIVDGAPTLGEWQRVMFIELDGPRSRSVTIQVIGE
ncbi:secondary thiamine-phosphate synthase enzyme YjbQ [Candidatus Bathyarchaeota archaeon]|nr:secondary thiamine-phosphate synthase enzyme YjbQ [Candidatus Bathyarchaeota archaeon]